MYRHIFAEINLDALEHNLDVISSIVPVSKIMAVVKANAYGHGAGAVAQTLSRKGVKNFAVSNLYEGMDLRNAGINGKILSLGYVEEDLVLSAIEKDITLTVYDLETAEIINNSAKGSGKRVNCHIKLDTGMGRLGFDVRENFSLEELKNQLLKLKELENLNITGGFTHFASADRDGDPNGEFTEKQYERFSKGVKIIKELWQENKDLIFHSSNSAATLLDWKNHPGDLYRAGIILYGLTPSQDLKLPIDLKPVMNLKAVVSSVKEIKAGESVSYGRTFKAPKNIKVATLTVGYADGYMRGLSNGGEVLIGKNSVPIIGRICMDQTMVDVTGLDVSPGDEVTLFGEGLPVETLAEKLGTINYETVCAVAHRVPRVYIKDGKIVDTVRYTSV